MTAISFVDAGVERAPILQRVFSLPMLIIAPFVLSVLLPFVRLGGPLSLDDTLPLAGVVVAMACVAFSRQLPRLDATWLPFLALAILGLVSAAYNAESVVDFTRLASRSAGRSLFFAMTVISVRSVLRSRDWARTALIAFVAVATIESIFCVFAYATKWMGPYGIGVVPFADWSVLKGNVRAQGTFSGEMGEYEIAVVSANFLAAYLVMAVPVTFSLALAMQNAWVKTIAIVCTGLQTVVIYLTFTRAALLALAGTILVMGWIAGKKRLALTVLVAALVLSAAIPSVRAKFMDEDHDRYALWWASLTMTADHAAFGVGDGNYETILHDEQKYFQTRFGGATTASHNSVLLAAANLGIVGGLAQLLLYGVLVYMTLRHVRGVHPADRFLALGLAGAVAGFLIQDQFNNLAFVPKVATQLWYLFAVLGALHDAAPRSKELA